MPSMAETAGLALEFGIHGEARDRVYATLVRLTAQGHIPVYYWIGRQHKDSERWLRPFLDQFTRAASDHLKVSREHPDQADRGRMNCYTMGRTANGQASLQGRYEILLDRLRTRARRHAHNAQDAA
jgi:hypothetical protein